MMMTCEVSRLQRERQMLEQQIADLFAFFAKQRAEMVSRDHSDLSQSFPCLIRLLFSFLSGTTTG